MACLCFCVSRVSVGGKMGMLRAEIHARYESFFADPMRFTVLGATTATASSG